MNQRSDIDRLLRHWMDDGPTRMPDRIVDVVADRISVQRQRRSWRLLRRLPMSPLIKLGAAAAAVLVIAVVAWQVLPRNGGIGGQPTATPSPSPTASALPSPAPSVGAMLPPWYTTSETPSGPGILPAGSHTTRSFRPGFTFSVPDGWVNDGDSAGYFSLFPNTPANEAEFGRSEGLSQSIAMGPHESPWYFCKSVENNRGATAAEMVTAVTANEALATSGLVDVEIGGLTGKQFDVRLNPDWAGTCPPQPDDPPGQNLAEQRVRGLLLDAPGRGVLVIFVYSKSSADFEAFLAEAMPIVESFQFSQ